MKSLFLLLFAQNRAARVMKGAKITFLLDGQRTPLGGVTSAPICVCVCTHQNEILRGFGGFGGFGAEPIDHFKGKPDRPTHPPLDRSHSALINALKIKPLHK
jgi:hypothetical protein